MAEEEAGELFLEVGLDRDPKRVLRFDSLEALEAELLDRGIPPQHICVDAWG